MATTVTTVGCSPLFFCAVMFGGRRRIYYMSLILGMCLCNLGKQIAQLPVEPREVLVALPFGGLSRLWTPITVTPAWPPEKAADLICLFHRNTVPVGFKEHLQSWGRGADCGWRRWVPP